MRWIWQQPGWPDFLYDKSALEDRELALRINSERLAAGSFDALTMASREEATVDWGCIAAGGRSQELANISDA